ncbi:MAG: 1-acyl-sn-glycerol-3-phosphate acyltransferase [Elusimicrobia bacterium]|nr:1-acyl-sn-glycerol-3-phosphate acyltransferase [Elusimicrobiota bacterium]MDE2236478.1 1-acyl-sn-glycerol-3-phosphate acyltransferase [Elusimicrobiota bacterium]MDE2424985.1 1-acyl-sn-glycerol-3-phosphate acyltransferase [Elusimicrobiota bacterium]
MLERRDLSALRRQKLWSAAFSWLTYAWVIAACKLYFGYSISDVERFREDIWRKLDAHDGPVIWAANHLTLIDSFLVFWAIFPWRRSMTMRLIPWSTPEYKNYYNLGGPIKKRLVRSLMYLCRCIPFKRDGEDEAAVRWRETAYAKCVEILREGGAVFVYPEAGRSRSGWFNRRKPKDFLGRMALDAPKAAFLCVYLRGDRQLYTTAIPDKGERFRVVGDLVPAVLPAETTPRQISQRLFDTLDGLQNRWFAASPLRRCCGGNDVVDLRFPLLQENMDPVSGEADEQWLDKHLTPRERLAWEALPAEKRFAEFWRYFAAKEAAHKALVQSGLIVAHGLFTLIEVDLFRRKALHRPTGAELDILFTDDDAEKLHCLAVLRGGWIGNEDEPGDVLWRVEELPAGRAPGEYVRERCLRFIAESNDEIATADKLAFSDVGGTPAVVYRGKIQDWGVSISHGGRFVACSFMIS